MKKTLLGIFIFFTTTTFSATITIEADIWPPYTNDPKKGDIGFTSEITKTILEKEGHTVKYVIVPWKRALENLKEGRSDILLVLYKSDIEEQGFVTTDETFGKSTNKFFVKKTSSWKFNGVESLLTERFGIIRGYAYPGLDDYIKNPKNINGAVQTVGGDEPLKSNLNKLIANRITVIADDQLTVELVARELNFSDKIKEAGILGNPMPLYVGISPKNPKAKELAKTLGTGILKLRKSGELKKILDKYSIKDWN